MPTNIIRRMLSRGKNHVNRLQQNKINHRLYFLHIPKCGGTSFVQAVRDYYRTLNPAHEQAYYHLDPYAATEAADALGVEHLEYQRTISLYFLAQDYEYVYGHLAFSNKAYELFHTKYKFVTLLRNPVSKWISLYFFNRYKKSDFFKISDDIETFLESDLAKGYGSDYAMQFAGSDKIKDFSSQQAIDCAVENLQRLDLVGKLEQIDKFTAEFEAMFGLKLQVKHKRKNPMPPEKRNEILTPEIRERIEALCQPNLAIYNALG